MDEDFLFTSESVSEGHPDKMADQISDAILDAILTKDTQARVACETVVTTGLVFLSGEITTQANIELEEVVRNVIHEIGYTNSDMGFDADSCAIINAIGKQSKDIAQSVDKKNKTEQGAGDQGLMFGYACNETEVFMPAPIVYAHRVMQRQAKIRKNGILPWLRPDAKTQITLQYRQNKPFRVNNLVFSTQHHPDINHTHLVEAVMEEIIKPTFPPHWLEETKYYINPSKRFVIGGPKGDSGLTGRKIMVDSYGGMSRHGGGCYSGKDPSKVDRSGAYVCRYIAKNIVAAGIADRCEIQIAYAIGVSEPTAIYVETFGTGKIPHQQIIQLINTHFDLRPHSIITMLDLLKPIYKSTACYGHFGRTDIEFSWEKLDKVDVLRRALDKAHVKTSAS